MEPVDKKSTMTAATKETPLIRQSSSGKNLLNRIRDVMTRRKDSTESEVLLHKNDYGTFP